MTIVHRLPLLFVACAGFFAAPACHSAFAADTPRTVTPSIDIEVEDRAPGNAAHTARFNVSLLNGHGDINASDGDSKYALSAHTISEQKLGLKVKRSDRSPSTEIEVDGAISAQPGERIVVARIDRADGHTTTVLARAH